MVKYKAAVISVRSGVVMHVSTSDEGARRWAEKFIKDPSIYRIEEVDE